MGFQRVYNPLANSKGRAFGRVWGNALQVSAFPYKFTFTDKLKIPPKGGILYLFLYFAAHEKHK